MTRHAPSAEFAPDISAHDHCQPADARLMRHEDTFLTLAETGPDRRFDMPFRKTFDYPGEFLTPRHQALIERIHDTGMIDIGIDGWLLPADALKLYEMAYCCGGDILELGSYRGLSTSVMLEAVTASGREATIVSVDLDAASSRLSCLQILSMEGGERVHFMTRDGTTAVRNLARSKRKFGFAFIDHSHEYKHVFSVCRILHRVVEVGGFVLFHDFNDPRNSMDTVKEYGVHQAAMDALRPDRWEFWGIYGCTGLFRRKAQTKSRTPTYRGLNMLRPVSDLTNRLVSLARNRYANARAR